MNPYHPDDRPSPQEQPIRARVPDHVSSGAFSTGVIVMTAQTEFILDFVQNLGRPHQIVARVIMPHNVLPQLVDALQRNIDLYRRRWGELPSTPVPKPVDQTPASPESPWGVQYASPQMEPEAGPAADASQPAEQPGASGAGGGGSAGGGAGGSAGGGATGGAEATPSSESPDESGSQRPPQLGAGTRQATAQEVYDDLKIKDELLSGAYANAVMIGHGAHEFSFDFITNFYPNSAVSARVFLAAGQVPRLYDSLKGTWDQMRARLQKRGPGDGPPLGEGPQPNQPPEDDNPPSESDEGRL